MKKIQALAKTGLTWAKNHAPELLLAGGILSLGGALYSAARAGTRTPGVLEEHKDELRDVKVYNATHREDQESIPMVYAHTSVKLVREYAPTVVLSGLSVTCFCASYGILKKRYVALTAAYTALEESFKLYRSRVIEDKGKDADIYYMTGQKPKEITIKKDDGTKEKKKVLTGPNGEMASPYAIKFSKYKKNGQKNLQWEADNWLNMSFVLGQMDYFNDQLYLRSVFDDDHKVVKRGSVMLNEILDALGEDNSEIGSLTGWRFGPGEDGCDGSIIFETYEGVEIDPATGDDIPYILVDPNVDGMIYDLLDQWEKVPLALPTYYRSEEDE